MCHPGLSTWTLTVPTAWAGVLTRSWLADSTVVPVPATPPNVTRLAPVRFEPVTVTVVPPAVGPDAGDSERTAGDDQYVKRPAVINADVPPGVVTWTLTVPTAWAGVLTRSWLADSTVVPVPATPPNVTRLAPVRFEPVTVTVVPPAVGPDAGDSERTAGDDAYVKRPAVINADVPPGVVTWTLTVPTAWAGVLTRSWLADSTVVPVPATPPNVTRLAPVRFEPVTVTVVPPAVGPDAGDSERTAGDDVDDTEGTDGGTTTAAAAGGNGVIKTAIRIATAVDDSRPATRHMPPTVAVIALSDRRTGA